MKAILIDSREMDVREIDVPLESGTYKEIPEALGCEYFSVATYLNDNADVLFVDDEGLMHNPEHFFMFDGTVIAGNGLVMGGDEEGDTVPPTVTVEEVLARVKWVLPAEAVATYNASLATAKADALRINESNGGDPFVIVAGPMLNISDDGKVVAL